MAVSEEATPPSTVLAEFVVQDASTFRGQPAEFFLVRMTIPAELTMPYVSNGGFDIYVIEEGTIKATGVGSGDVQIVGSATSETPLGDSPQLRPGDSLKLGNVTGVTLSNDGSDPSVLIALMLAAPEDTASPYPAEESVRIQATFEAMTKGGLSFELIASGHPFALPKAPISVRIQRDVIAPGASITIASDTGLELAGMEQGTAEFLLAAGSAREVWPKGPESDREGMTQSGVTVGTPVPMEAEGIHFIAEGATGSLTNSSSAIGEAVILRVIVEPVTF